MSSHDKTNMLYNAADPVVDTAAKHEVWKPFVIKTTAAVLAYMMHDTPAINNDHLIV